MENNNEIFDVNLAEEAQEKSFNFAVSNPMLTKEYSYNVASTAQAPFFKAIIGKDFVPYGVNRQNNYPDQLIKLFTQSSLHGRILKTKVKQILGQGFIFDEKDPAAQITAPFVQECNDGEESLFQVMNKVILDWQIFGGFSFLIHWNQEWTKINAIEHIDFSKVRVPPVTNDGGIPFYWYSPDWQTQRPKKVGIPCYNRASAIENKLAFQKALAENNSDELEALIRKNGSTTQMYRYCPHTPGNYYYPWPDYVNAITSILADIQSDTYGYMSLRNGFSADTIITLYGHNDPAEGQKEAQKFLRQHAEARNAGRPIVRYAKDKDNNGIDVSRVANNGTDNKYKDVNSNSLQKILSGHGVTSPNLFGIMTPGSLGATDELQNGYELFNAYQILPYQLEFVTILNKIFKVNGFASLSIKPIEIKFGTTEATDPLAPDTSEQKPTDKSTDSQEAGINTEVK
jgi:hypothetical protein